ncbi:MAG: carboxypeptidase-like regulatory domain-containing protein, partial [Tannerella sp.]|nr:carboxypeptidase-like regulatory domain-containing protein [Tannerella sp.]
MYYKIFLFLFLVQQGITAQVRLSGTVVDADSKAPLEFASVVLLGQDSTFINGMSCDSTGCF